MTIFTKGWIKWLNKHKTYETYNAYPIAFKGIYNAPKVKNNFKDLSKAKNLVLLTKALMGGKCQATFFHSTVGIPIIPDDLKYVSRVGMKLGTSMELEPKSLFQTTSAKYKPDLADLMKVANKANLGKVEANEDTPKKNKD